MGLLGDLLYPPYARCFGCGHPRLDAAGDHLCAPCREKLRSLALSSVPFFVEGVEKVYAPYPYEGVAREIVHTLKYACVRDAAKVLGPKMAACLDGKAFDALVPVPLHPGRLAERGFNQAELLANAVAEITKTPVLPALSRLRETGQQAKLSRAGRLTNMEGAFQCTQSVKGMRLLLVDDVSTTGATAHACARELYAAGAKQVSLLAAAVTL